MARLESKGEHVSSRLNNLVKFKLTDIQKTQCEGFMASLKEVWESICNLNYDKDVLNKTLRQLNVSIMME